MINYHLIGKCYSELQRNVKDIKNYTYKVLMYYLAKLKYGDVSLVNKLNTAHYKCIGIKNIQDNKCV